MDTSMDTTIGSNEVTFGYGGKHGGRIRPEPVSFFPGERTRRKDTTPPEVLADITAFFNANCPTSPCARDKVVRFLGPGQKEEARRMIRYSPWTSLWADFTLQFPASADKIGARIFRVNAPWQLRKGGTESCLCQKCETLERMSKARHAVAQFLEDRYFRVADAAQEDDGEGEEDWTWTGSRNQRLESLIALLRLERKYEFCANLTCEGREPGGRLVDAKTKCVDGSCTFCGFARLWSKSVRNELLTFELGKQPRLRDDLHTVWDETVHWSCYRKEFTDQEGGKAVSPAELADPTYGENKSKKQLVVESRSGTVVEFLDELEGLTAKAVQHRSTLDRQKASAAQFARNLRPGILCRDCDYAENFTIEEAKQVQSEHWTNKQCTLFISIVSYLLVDKWDATAGPLIPGDEVTINGEMSGASVNLDAKWARVVGKEEDAQEGGNNPDDERYRVVDFAGNESVCARSTLRHRVLYQQCFVGVTGDRKHDSYSMRHFSQEEWAWLVAHDVIATQKITTVATHSDNAAQHFKSSKTLCWYTSWLAAAPGAEGIKSSLWDFGPPGHGKGVWDGIAGMLKQWLRSRIFEGQHKSGVIKTTSGAIRTPFDCFEQLTHGFHGKPTKTIDAFTVVWAGMGKISSTRPRTPAEFCCVKDITKTYQYYVTNLGEVAARAHSCWCPSCFVHATAKPTTNGWLAGDLRVPGCIKSGQALYKYSKRSCEEVNGSARAQRHAASRANGKAAAQTLHPDEWVLFEAPDGDEDEEVWLGKAVQVNGGAWEGKVWSTCAAREDIAGVRFDRGDVKVAVKWYEYHADDDEYDWWESDETPYHVMNATSLRYANPAMEQQGGVGALAVRPRRGPQAGAERQRERSRRWKVDAVHKAEAVQACGGQ